MESASSIFGIKDDLERYHITRSSDFGIIISDAFLNCANEKLTNDFMLKTGVEDTKRVYLSFSPTWVFFGDVTRLSLHLMLNGEGFGNVWVAFKSRSGKRYKMHEEDWNSNDVDFWFEQLDVTAINARLNHKTKLPFAIKNLHYEIVVNGLHLSGSILAELLPVAFHQRSTIANNVISFVHDYNQKAEKLEQGVVHRIDYKETSEGIAFYIDYGSVGVSFLKQLLTYMNSLDCFQKITLDDSSFY